jgi:4-amino-4-deoxy-L-arabinose transferase-like glycosyltransferase
MFNKDRARNLLSENYPLLSIIVGTTLISLSIGPFQNWDSAYEFEAAMGIIKWGMPYVNNFGSIINQPPIGFYIEALFFRIFGASISLGTALMTLFGLGSTVLVYLIGREMYSKKIGLVAAALFALSPWELVLTRSFLIDALYLFPTLVCLYVGILAIKRDSIKLALASGVLFAAAFLTKYFAIFIVIPLLIYYIYSKPKNFKRTLAKLIAFALPVLACYFLWYQVILGQNLLHIFHHSDFVFLNDPGVVPTYSFVATFLWNESLGYFFVIAVALSLILYFVFRKELPKAYFFDLICLGTIVPILVVNMILGAGLDLKAPYNNAIKYDYVVLPFFCLLGASLVGKCQTLFNSAKMKTKLMKRLILAIVAVSVILLAVTLVVDVFSANSLSLADYLLFRMRLNQAVGYSFFNYNPMVQGSLLMYVQYVGFGVLLSGFLWATKLYGLFKPVHVWIQRKNVKNNAQ